MMRAVLLAFVLAASTARAHADVWQHALRGAAEDQAQATYDAKLREGDEHAMLANTRSATYAEVKNQINLAVTAYRAAAAAKPAAADPWFRIGRLLSAMYLECDDPTTRAIVCNPRGFDVAHAEQVIDAWDEFEKRAPMDPRLSVNLFDTDILFPRAILHTKLASRAHLEAAARDYETILARSDTGDGMNERVLGNLAETYMMLGRLEEAIDTYKEALRGASDTSTWYGFAVALDRDERTDQALDVIRSLGEDERDNFHANVMRGRTFFVPAGEKYYYFALVDEALGSFDDAIEGWKAFIDSGAHPQYQPRAKAHLDALLKKRKSAPPANPPTPRPWPTPID
jgi:tetratricopeptide (TPR) repeat protein